MKKSSKPQRPAKGAMPKDTSPAPAAEDLIDMDEAIRALKTTRPTFYRWLRGGKIKGMKVGRQWRFYRADIDRFLKGEEPRIDLAVDVTPLTDALRKKAAELGLKMGVPKSADADGRVVEAVDLIIWMGFFMRGSDIHLAPMLKAVGGEPIGTVRIRVDGVLQTISEFDMRLLRPLVERWKTMAACNLHETRLPQDGRILVKVSGRELDLRVSFVPSQLGEALTVRILDAGAVRLNFDATPFNPADKEKLRRHLQAPAGVILCVGPTGSGKTTTLYACLDLVNTPANKVMSVEDPVEYLIPNMVQIPVRPNVGLTFGMAIRSILRSDPDIILVGEIRDLETVNVAQQAALTGHLVLSTLHTAQAADALVRMVEMGAAPFIVADATRAIVAQRLVRVLCPKCKRPAEPSANLVAAAQQLALDGGLDWSRMERHFHEPVGCPECRNIGFRGRTVMAEVLEVTPEIGAALRRGTKAEELQSLAVRQGMTTLAADGVRRAAAGQTTLTEVLRVLGMK
ncbi:MAG: hypothetical protein A3K19_24265 [Lentisphaerae bacterium RIFOXYB12_FULL_65_16]|nr:MAG: hypothetical protein A3K18_32450 [Lentisphaerae bacterium RIFOXYA12_64_32]OGV87609.1 MAG: hypothetical protein A3K19_24265 [Lentisphaerae bacterium RIFOXYB12_FULL_65_16]